eukprot:s94_g57.t1
MTGMTLRCPMNSHDILQEVSESVRSMPFEEQGLSNRLLIMSVPMVELRAMAAEELRQGQISAGDAMKLFLAELRQIAFDSEGHLVCTKLQQRLKHVWLQGYVLCRDGDDVIDLDDGSAVMSLDVARIVACNQDASAALQAGRYISCVCSVEFHPQEGILDLRVESACPLDDPGDALAEPFWFLEVAESHKLRELSRSQS